jgi:uncharacterized protein YbjT (DUF2867 family)
MSIVLVTGGTGTLGRHLVPLLAARGHQVRVLSRREGAGTHRGDLITGVGLAEAADGAELAVHLASDRRLGRTDTRQTSNLVAALGSCTHLVYVSIVGVDMIPFRYYQAKLACERIVETSGVPATTLRATQFHELLAGALRAAARLPVPVLPLDLVFQSVAAAEVADRVAEVLDGPPLRRAPDFGGPEVLTGWQLTGTWRAYHGWPANVLNARLPGRGYRAFADGLNTCPDHADGRQTWAQFAAAQREPA